ncbi:IQ domain-containing protein E [Holothuria leucospilota]|uniref:IQ domain-containing protein E n=2 Tax=Holothuria leucospilota TaxID=206669 RepID=A0A9Q1C2P6_HOLLE|nr:IQ domain-containing protein E [Holothuria leucospilota]
MPTIQEAEDISDMSYDSDLSDNDVELPRAPSEASHNGTGRKGSKRTKAAKKPPSPYHNKSASKQGRSRTPSTPKRNPRELWLENLRAGGNGLTGASKSSNYMGTVNRSFKPGNFDSASDYLKETVLGMPPKRRSRVNTMDGAVMGRSSKGLPTYKPQEDMYDDILDLKKQVNALSKENDRLKARNRRLEDEHVKKEKQIEQLLDPTQGDLRLTLSSRQPDAAAKMSSLKQKNLKLEMVLKDKEAELSKLQGDLKSTKIEEMKVAMESFYSEVQRLRHQLSTNGPGSASRGGKQGTLGQDPNVSAKVKALNSTILRLTEGNQKLQSENKLLKTDLERALQAGDSTDDERTSNKSLRNRDYEDMNRKQLLKAISRLEEKVEKTEGTMKKSSQRKSEMPGKVELTGSLSDRLDILDKRETELMEENSQLSKEVARLKEDKSKLRQKVEELEDENKKQNAEIKELRQEMRDERKRFQDDLKEERRRVKEETKSSRPRSPSSESLRSSKSSKKSSASRSNSQVSLRKKEREDERWRKEQEKKAEELRLNRSAKSIQRNWRAHQKKVKDDEEIDEAAKTIQSAMRGHKQRKDQMDQFTPTTTEVVSSEENESDVDYAARTIQSAVRGHWSRKDQLTKMSMTDSETESVHSSRSRASTSHKGHSSHKRLDSEGDSDDNIMVTPSSSRKGSMRGSRPSSAHSSSKKRSSSSSISSDKQRNKVSKSKFYEQQVESFKKASAAAKNSKMSRYMFT